MALYQGDKPIVDRYVGSRFVERVYHGSNLIFDAYTEVTGLLPIVYKSRATVALKNYRLYGTSEGAGVETENLFDYTQRDTDKGFVRGAMIASDGAYRQVSNWGVSEYIGIDENIAYVWRWTDVTRPTQTTASVGFYDSTKTFISGIAYDGRGVISFTTPANAKFIRTSFLLSEGTTLFNCMLVIGSTAPASYIPYGYQLPLTNTSGETENLWNPDEITMGQTTTIVYNYLQLEPSTEYTAWTTLPYNETSDVFIRTGRASSVTSSANGFSDGHPRTVTTNAEGWLTIATRYNDARPNPIDYVYMLVKGSTAPDHYIPHRYTADYNIYIGSTKLGAEEYVDFGEQKMQKRTVNRYNHTLHSADNGYVWGYYLNANGGNARGTVWRITEYISVSEGVYTLAGARDVSTASAYIGLYDSTKTLVSTIAISPAGENTEITVPSGVAFVRLSVQNSVTSTQTMLVEGADVPAEYVPYFVLIDPPVSLPAITAYKGENTLSSTEVLGNVTVKGRIKEVPILGYYLTQSSYDGLTPEEGKYYAVSDSGTGDAFRKVTELTSAEYEDITTPDVQTLYIVTDGTTISGAYYGTVELDKLYLGNVELWSAIEYELPDWFPRIDVESIFAPYQSYSQYYYDFCCQKINTTDGIYAYIRIYCENAADGEIGLLDNGGVDTYFTWYTARSGHRVVAYRFGGDYQPTYSQGNWTNNREYASNYIGGNSKQAYSPKPCVIKKTMTHVNFVGAITPDKIGF